MRYVYKKWGDKYLDGLPSDRKNQRASRMDNARWFMRKQVDTTYLKDMRHAAFTDRLHHNRQSHAYCCAWAWWRELVKRPFSICF